MLYSRMIKSFASRISGFDPRGFHWMWRESLPTFPREAARGLPWPRLSIITPSYNQGRFLEETIRSVLFQGYPNLEYIIVDGGSTDNSIEIIRKYEDRLSYWVSEKDRGQAHAVNKGLDRATGDIVGWINSDDVYASRTFAIVMSHFAKCPELGLVYGSRILIDEDTHVSGWAPTRPYDPEFTGYNICSETAFWRRKPDDPRLRDELRFALDVDFFVRLFHSRQSLHLEDFLGCFRCYPENKSSTMQDVGKQETIEIWESLYGAGHSGWSRRYPVSRFRLFRSFASHPGSVAIPYLYRRFFFQKGGAETLSPG